MTFKSTFGGESHVLYARICRVLKEINTIIFLTCGPLPWLPYCEIFWCLCLDCASTSFYHNRWQPNVRLWSFLIKNTFCLLVYTANDIKVGWHWNSRYLLPLECNCQGRQAWCQSRILVIKGLTFQHPAQS